MPYFTVLWFCLRRAENSDNTIVQFNFKKQLIKMDWDYFHEEYLNFWGYFFIFLWVGGSLIPTQKSVLHISGNFEWLWSINFLQKLCPSPHFFRGGRIIKNICLTNFPAILGALDQIFILRQKQMLCAIFF